MVGCAPDSTVNCSGGGTGYACAVGDTPETTDQSLSCTTPTVSGGVDDYCCFPPIGDDTTCAPDDDVPGCPSAEYGFQCSSGDDPEEYDSTLSCSAPAPDGVHDDYCCSYPGGSSSGATPPAGCMADATLDCVGGADGYSCTSGDNPEAEDTTLSCSTPSPDSDGKDDYCCYSGGTWSSTTCEPDDDLTSVCPDPTSYGYQCDPGDDPTSYDSTLSCSTGTPDPDGVHDDYCCTYT